MTNWIYMNSERNLWTVGFYSPDGTWHADSDHPSPDKAAERVHWLNGGVDVEDLVSTAMRMLGETLIKAVETLMATQDKQQGED